MARPRGGNYVNSGGFNRLAGRPSAPGSWRPESYFVQWKTLYILLFGAFLLIGLFFMIF